MGSRKTQYSFDVSLSYYLNNKTTPINRNLIKSIVLNRDYLKFNRPTLFLIMMLDSSTYTTIANNMNDGQFILTIQKYDTSNSISKTNYIKYNFNYIMDVETDKIDATETEDYHRVLIGLYLQSNVDNNKKRIINNIFKNTNTISIIHYYTKHMKMVYEKFTNNRNIPLLIVQPLESVTELLKYLNSVSSFYDTEYLFFMDFDYTYLISTRGNEIDVKDNTYTTVQINIVEDDMPTKDQTFTINSDKKFYSFNVDSGAVDVNVNRIVDNSINVVSGVSTDGFKTTSNISANKTSGSGNKETTIRVHNDNLAAIKEMKNTMESKSVILTITKVGLDPSLFTPTKKYIVKGESDSKNISGNYMLVGKKELFNLDKEDYVCITVLTLQKVS